MNITQTPRSSETPARSADHTTQLRRGHHPVGMKPVPYQPLPTDDAVLAAYRDHFGIVLDHVPTAAAGVAWLGSGGRGRARPVLHLLRVDAEFLGGLLLGPGHGGLDRLLDLGLTDDDEACVARIDEITEFLDAGS